MTALSIIHFFRGIAACWVLSYHFQFSDDLVKYLPNLQTFFSFGYLGVFIFFIISGFCIASAADKAMQQKAPSVQLFLKRRFFRIYPAFFASVFFVAALPFVSELFSFFKTGEFLFPSSEYMDNRFLSFNFVDWFSIFSLTRIFLPAANAVDLQARFNEINGVYWTLAIEVQFYLVVALAIHYKKYFKWIIFLLAIIGLFFPILPYFRNTGFFLEYWPIFSLGFLIYYSYTGAFTPQKLFGQWHKQISLLSVITSLSAMLILLFSYPTLANKYTFSFLFAIFLFFLLDFEGVFKTCLPQIVSKPLILLGNMSYSIYLIHLKLRILSVQISRQILAQSTLTQNCLALGLILIVCYFFYLLFEKPFLQKKQKNLNQTTV